MYHANCSAQRRFLGLGRLPGNATCHTVLTGGSSRIYRVYEEGHGEALPGNPRCGSDFSVDLSMLCCERYLPVSLHHMAETHGHANYGTVNWFTVNSGNRDVPLVCVPRVLELCWVAGAGGAAAVGHF